MVRAVVACAFSCLLGFCPSRALAAPGSQFNVARAGLVEILARTSAVHGMLCSYEGTIVGLEHGRCLLSIDGGVASFALAPGCVVMANGKSACAEVLRPVTQEASFWAEVWVDVHGNLRVIEAVYYGGELRLTAVSRGSLSGLSPENQAIVTLPVATGCLPENLLPGTQVYVLLDLDGRVRWLKVLPNSNLAMTQQSCSCA